MKGPYNWVMWNLILLCREISEGLRVGAPGLGSRLSTYWPTKMVQQMTVYSAQLCRSNSALLRPHRVTWIVTKGDGVKNGCSGALKPGKQAWFELQSHQLQRRRDWGPRRATYPRNITMFPPWWCRRKGRKREISDRIAPWNVALAWSSFSHSLPFLSPPLLLLLSSIA